ncbi:MULTISPECIES: ParA family protein [Deinococcus]|uniref:ParA family protein n=1 Tax=Deinococcus rufus TaxID=2136097 RepID=A0ABV7Z754_9DEIO|nr:ParA family protein [Deinococcus sp. AB2017081]WQE97186.1 ParA family protein [Deinococcus sp. AB2017081]
MADSKQEGQYAGKTVVISAVMKKGGAGKTSTIVPLAYLAALTGARVALIDMDTTPSAEQWVNAAELAGETLACDRVTAEELEPLLAEIKASGLIDFVFIDTPPGDKHIIVQAMSESDLVLMPVHIGSGDLPQLLETYHLMKLPLRANPALQHLIVVNHGGTMPAVTRDTVEAIREGIPEARLARTVVPYSRLYALGKGSRPDGKWWHFTQLWDEIREALA